MPGVAAGQRTEQKIDDIRFTKAIITTLASEACIDAKRVYATGCSNGGGMAFKVGCDAADVIAGIAPVDFDCVTSAAANDRTCGTACAPPRPIAGGSVPRHRRYRGPLRRWIAKRRNDDLSGRAPDVHVIRVDQHVHRHSPGVGGASRLSGVSDVRRRRRHRPLHGAGRQPLRQLPVLRNHRHSLGDPADEVAAVAAYAVAVSRLQSLHQSATCLVSQRRRLSASRPESRLATARKLSGRRPSCPADGRHCCTCSASGSGRMTTLTY